MSRLEAVTEAFRGRAGREPDGVWAAPGRVNLIGEHTDYNDGFVLPVAIDRLALVAVARRPDDVFRCWSLQMEGEAEVSLADIAPGRVAGWTAYPQGAARALIDKGVGLGGVDVMIDSDVPLGSGLSSSAALICGVVLALADLHGAGLSRVDLALAARDAEWMMTGAPIGVMDHVVAMLGRTSHALFLDCRSLDHELLPLDLAESRLTLVVIDTGVAHRLADGAYAERRRSCEEAARALGVATLRDVSVEQVEAARGRLDDTLYRRARHVVTENARVMAAVSLVRDGQAEELGPLFTRSHASLRYDFDVSVPELDVAVAAAEAAGALGARLTGAGFGGSALALTPSDRYQEVVAGVEEDFATCGFKEPAVFTVEIGDGAGRVAK